MIKIAMVVLSSYPLDVRVRREAEALVDSGMKVDVLCRTSRGEKPHEIVNGVDTYRVKMKRRRKGQLGFLFEYGYFLPWATFKLLLLCFKNRYDIIHIHNMPDFLAFTALIPKLTGSKVILDLHDPMPELFSAMKEVDQKHPFIKILKFIEKFSIKFADRVLTPNIAFKKLFISRGCPPEKIDIIMNSPDELIFSKEHEIKLHKNSKDEFLVMYHGAIVERHGLDIAIHAIAKLTNKIPNIKLIIYGEGDHWDKVLKTIEELGLEDFVKHNGLVMVDEIAGYIPRIDLGIIPNRINSFTQLNFPVRIFEYLTYQIPVIVPRTKGIRDYFDEDAIFYFEPENVEDLANCIFNIYKHKNDEKIKEVVSKSFDVYQSFKWKYQKNKLLNLVTDLVYS